MSVELHHSYTVRIYWSKDIFCYEASCVEIPSIHVQGTDRNSVLDAVDTQIETLIKNSLSSRNTLNEAAADKRYRGKIPLRITPATHQSLARLSAEEGISMNCLIGSIIETNLRSTGREEHCLLRLEYDVKELKVIINKLYNEVYSLLHTLKDNQI